MFFLFGYDEYYPAGGMDDYVGAYETLELAQEAGAALDRGWWHIATIDDTGNLALVN